MDIIKAVEADYLNKDAVKLEIGDYVKVSFKVIEGSRERIQVFEGTVIGMRGEGVKETFTVRKIAYGVGVERVFPVHSPKIAGIEVVRHGKIRRAKLYYLRSRVGKAARVKEKL
jgi:large subunit ribosomal protein L19